jgi:hypothetical protein
MLSAQSGELSRVPSERLHTCRRLVAEARRFSVEFRPFMANHLPMVLVALDRMGASPRRLETFFETYRATSGLEPAQEGRGRIDAGNWAEHLGERGLEGDFRAYFAAEVARLGMAEAQRRNLGKLVPGIAASALHALMRLAYADLEGDPEEAGTALGYWAMTFLPLCQAGEGGPATDDPAAILAELRTIAALREIPPPETDLLWHWMRAVAAHPTFPPVVDRLAPSPDLLDRVAEVSLAFYAATMTFEALHALTGCHWLRLVRPRWPDEALAVRYFWQAICAVYPKIGMPALPPADAIAALRHEECPGWPEIMARACASDDEHDISLVFSASEEARRRGDRLYQVVAARRVGLLR